VRGREVRWLNSLPPPRPSGNLVEEPEVPSGPGRAPIRLPFGPRIEREAEDYQPMQQGARNSIRQPTRFPGRVALASRSVRAPRRHEAPASRATRGAPACGPLEFLPASKQSPIRGRNCLIVYTNSRACPVGLVTFDFSVNKNPTDDIQGRRQHSSPWRGHHGPIWHRKPTGAPNRSTLRPTPRPPRGEIARD